MIITFEQLQLNPELVSVWLLGTITTEDLFFKIAYKFIRNCALLDVSTYSKTFDVTQENMLHHFILFNT